MTNAAQHINQTSGNVEWYTDPLILEAAREVMGGIDLDPFSCAVANEKFVKAAHYFTQEDDGLNQDWFGKVWMNHPFGRTTNAVCIHKLMQEYYLGNIEQACCITFAATSELWFQPLLRYPQCFMSPRTNYYDGRGNKVTGVTKGSVVTYIGHNIRLFRDIFSLFGVVK